ncbi:helix-turn-helix transcriptional regulator [Rhodanobacter sp. B2A1Ga4]|nr:helix-turn-helix transcriptional regulator [Rhodanobacter sp. B2A1Ga4]
MQTSQTVKMLSALAQESRLAIFRLLVAQGPEGLPVGTIGERLDIPNATLSFHLKELLHAGASSILKCTTQSRGAAQVR